MIDDAPVEETLLFSNVEEVGLTGIKPRLLGK